VRGKKEGGEDYRFFLFNLFVGKKLKALKTMRFTGGRKKGGIQKKTDKRCPQESSRKTDGAKDAEKGRQRELTLIKRISSKKGKKKRPNKILGGHETR